MSVGAKEGMRMTFPPRRSFAQIPLPPLDLKPNVHAHRKLLRTGCDIPRARHHPFVVAGFDRRGRSLEQGLEARSSETDDLGIASRRHPESMDQLSQPPHTRELAAGPSSRLRQE